MGDAAVTDLIMGLATLLPCLFCIVGACLLKLRDKEFWWTFLVAAVLILPSIHVHHD